MYKDQIERFPYQSLQGDEYIMIMHGHDANATLETGKMYEKNVRKK